MKLAGDGTTVGKRIHCVLFSFTVLEEEDTVSSMDGIHPIAIFREPESYEVLSLALADVIKEVAELSLSGIEKEGVHYRVCSLIFDIFKQNGLLQLHFFYTGSCLSTLEEIGSSWLL